MTLSTSAIKKKIILCADDYAQNTSISEGILHLIDHGRVNATSCMVNATSWNETHHALKAVQSRTFIGLHFNLTEGEALSSDWKKHYGTRLPTMLRLLQMSYFRQLNPTIVAIELQAQMDAFTDAMNACPDFIDGHQHVHQLPIIRDALLAVCANHTMFFRSTSHGISDVLSMDGFPKRQCIALLGGITFHQRLKQKNLSKNSSFSGIYDFSHAANYRHYFKRFLMHSQDGGLIMCHPGNPSNDVHDPLRFYRHHELNYFMSDQYINDLVSMSFQLRNKTNE